MFKVNLIEKINITLNFGGDKKIEVGSGNDSKGVLVVSSPLSSKAINLLENQSQQNVIKRKSRNKS